MAGIIIVQSRIENARKIRDILRKFGYNQTVAVSTISSALNRTQDIGCGILISGTKLSDGSYKDLYEMMPDFFEMLLLTSNKELAEKDIENLICLSSPIVAADLVSTCEMMLRQMDARVKKNKAKTRSKKQNEYIALAKKILMEKNNMTEPEAYRYIQKNSMDSGTNMVETAQMILSIFS